MELISNNNKGMPFFLCLIDIFNKYAWVVPLKDKKGITIANTFQKVLDESKGSEANIPGCKPSKILGS